MILESIWTHWHAHPDVLIGLTILEGGYLLLVGPLRKRYNLAGHAFPGQTATFTLGILVIFMSLLSPLHILSDKYLFSAHMVQHVLLTLVAPPLLLIGTPGWLISRILRPTWIFVIARTLVHPIVAIVIFNIVFSIWHLPRLYNLSVTNHGIHIGEHLLFIASALLMWWPLTSKIRELPRLSYPLQMVYLFVLSIAQIIVFGTITFSPEPLYEWYVNAPQIWSHSALADQQVGAVIMKVGSGLLFITLAICAFFRWYTVEQSKDTYKIRQLRISME